MLIWPQPNYRPVCVHSQTTDTCETVGHTGCLRSEFLTTGFLHLFLHRQKEQFLFEKFSVALGWTLKRDRESFFLHFRHKGEFSSMQWLVMFKVLFFFCWKFLFIFSWQFLLCNPVYHRIQYEIQTILKLSSFFSLTNAENTGVNYHHACFNNFNF